MFLISVKKSFLWHNSNFKVYYEDNIIKNQKRTISTLKNSKS